MKCRCVCIFYGEVNLTKSHMSLVVVKKTKCKDRFRVEALLLFYIYTENFFNNISVLVEGTVPQNIPVPYFKFS
jgi:hypothetical protein